MRKYLKNVESWLFSFFEERVKRFLLNILQLKLDVSSIVFRVSFFMFSPKIQEYKQVAHPISTYKYLSCAALTTKLTTGSGNAGNV
jgi:hypothetical protein